MLFIINKQEDTKVDIISFYIKPNIISYSRNKTSKWLGHIWKADGKTIEQAFEEWIIDKILLGKTLTSWRKTMRKIFKLIQKDTKNKCIEKFDGIG